jgi:hypothetical protein
MIIEHIENISDLKNWLKNEKYFKLRNDKEAVVHFSNDLKISRISRNEVHFNVIPGKIALYKNYYLMKNSSVLDKNYFYSANKLSEIPNDVMQFGPTSYGFYYLREDTKLTILNYLQSEKKSIYCSIS